MNEPDAAPGADRLQSDIRLLADLLGETLRERDGDDVLALVDGVRKQAVALRTGQLEGGRDAFAKRVAALDLESLEQVARAFTQFFHLMNVAEEQQRIRMLRRRDRDETPTPGSIASACAEMKRAGATPDDVRTLLGRMFVMPVLTAHPTEARRRTLLDHLHEVSVSLDRLDDPRPGARERREVVEVLREAVLALHCTEEARASRPTPFDEVRAGLHVFERTLLDATPAIYRALEEALEQSWPNERFTVPSFLRWGTWIGGDRDGNPNVTAETTRMALERQRALALSRYVADVEHLGRELSVSARRVPFGGLLELEESLEADRARMPEIAARARRYATFEPWREKLLFMHAKLDGARVRSDAGYADPRRYRDDLRLLERTLAACGLSRLAKGPVRDARRRVEVFGFHLASLDLRQHSALHQGAVAELLARGGVPGYDKLGEEARVARLGALLDRADVGVPRDLGDLSPGTQEILATLDVVGRARRDLGPEACERYVISFTSEVSDVLEVLFLVRAAHLAPDELRPVPLLEQLQDLSRASSVASRMLELPAVRAAVRGELEVMIGYSDSGKQAGYVASSVALHRAQEDLAKVADDAGVLLTVFHGRGGAIGRGGGPANRSIRAQPPRALRGRLRVTEQGETIAARYGRPEIARRDLEQMISAVLVASVAERAPVPEAEQSARVVSVERAADAARRAYESLLADRDRLAAYAVAATPIQEVADLPLASRPASRRAAAGLAFEELRAIPWVFSWNQSRHAIPGWFGLGSAIDDLCAHEGGDRARDLYERWPFFRALIDNAQLALARSDIEVASHYARLAGKDARGLFDIIRAEHERTVAGVLSVTGATSLLSKKGALKEAVDRRNPYIDVLSHAQIELLRRLRAAYGAEREHIREILFITINGIAAGLQTAG